MTRYPIVATMGIVAALVLVGCSGSPASAPMSFEPSATPTGKPVPPYSGAPKVAHPLPLSAWNDGPCTALTPEQVKDALGIEAVGKLDTLSGVGPTCSWANIESGSQINVYFATETGQGLSGVYANTKPQMPMWKELSSIQGFPAVAYSNKADGGNGFCQVTFGLTDTVSVDVGLTIARNKIGKVDPCTITPRVADAVVTTLKKKAGA